MRSCVAPFDGLRLRPWLDVDPLACRFNVVFTSPVGWESELIRTADVAKLYLKPRDGHLFFYTCPNSIYWDDEFERASWREDLAFERYRLDNFHRFPYAKDCITYEKDGKPMVAYPWPSRRHRTSYFATKWVEHHKQVMDYMVKGKDAVTNPYLRKYMKDLRNPGIVAGFYFDNAGHRQDWGPLAMARWRKLSEEHFGKVIDPKTTQDLRARALWQEMQHRAYLKYHNAFRKHGWTYDPPRLTLLGAHGPYGYYAAEYNYPDIEFYENTYRVQPQGDNIWAIKCGLARTHGKAQACLNHERFRPAKLTPDRSFSVLHWTLSREFARLSLAECMAMAGNHMVQIGPLVYAHTRYSEDYRLFHDFNHALEDEIYFNSLPGSKLAVLWPIASEMRGTADNEPLGQRLWQLGLPYEVVIEHDLTPEVWPKMRMRTLILPDAKCLKESRIATILAWVRDGGCCVVSEALGERDEHGFQQVSESARQLIGNVGGRMRFSATFDFALEHFESEGRGRIWLPALHQYTKKTPFGSAKLTFEGAAGTYDLQLDYIDEDDGCSTIAICRNQDVLLEFKLDQPGGVSRLKKVIPSVELKPGDVIRIDAKQDGDEFCRIYGLELLPKGADLKTLTYRDVGKGRVAFAPRGLMSYDDQELTNILRKLTGKPAERCTYSVGPETFGAVSCNFMRDSQKRGVQVHLVNATYQTPERYAPLRSTNYVCRADIQVDKIPRKPVVRALCWGIGKTWQLAVSLNGTDLQPVDASKLGRTKWIDVPVDPALIKEGQRNRVTLRLAGKPNTYNSHAAVFIDTEKTEPQSGFSQDGGKTFKNDDLSTLNDAQRGAFMVGIESAYPRTPNPPEMRVRLAPQQDLTVTLHEDTVRAGAAALLVSPELPPQRLALQRRDGLVTLTVPRLETYDVVVLSDNASYLEGIEVKAHGIKYDPLPPRTPEFKALLRAGAVGAKLDWGSLEGDHRLKGVTSIDPKKVTARNDSRSFGKDLAPGKEFVVEPDGRLYLLPGCRASFNVVYLTWTDVDGGHYRQRHAAYLRPAEGQLIPPGWWCYTGTLTKIYRETAAVHEGRACVRVVTKPRGALKTISQTTDPGRPYRLSIWLKVLKGEARVRVTNGADAEPVRCAASEWTQVTMDLTATAKRIDFQAEGARGHPESIFLVDDASLRELP